MHIVPLIQSALSNSPVPLGDGLPRELGVPGGPVGLGPPEVHRRPDLLDPGAVRALHNLLLHLQRLPDVLGGRAGLVLGLVIAGGGLLLGRGRLLGHRLLGRSLLRIG